MKQSKKLLSSVLVLVIALAMAISSTWAWFTMSQTANISGLDVKVTAYEGMEIAATTKGATFPGKDKFKVSFTGDELKTAIALASDFELDAVTTPDGVGTFTFLGGGAATGKYIEFDLHFLANSAYDIVLDFEGDNPTKVDSERGEAPEGTELIKAYWTTAILGNYASYFVTAPEGNAPEAGSEIAAHAKNAIRISFEEKAESNKKINIFEPNDDTGFNGTANLAWDYYKEKTGDATTPAGTPATSTIKQSVVEAKAAEQKKSDSLLKLVSDEDLEAYVGTVTVRIWIEGWDGDALNTILLDKLTIDFKFNIK